MTSPTAPDLLQSPGPSSPDPIQPPPAPSAGNADQKMLRVVIADDHPVVRIGVRNLLATHGRFSVVSETQSIAETVQRAIALTPDILLMDLDMPEGSGIEALRVIEQNAPGVRVVLLTGAITPQVAVEAFLVGARGVVLKSELSDSISVALLAVCEGAYWSHGRPMEARDEVLRKYTQTAEASVARTYRLTRRELEVTALIVKGYSNRDIAHHLKLSEETVKRHLSNVFEKLGISTRLELAILAIEKNFATRA